MVRLRRTGLNRVRSTVVVGTVVSKRAVVRNRAKRQLRHILKEVLNQAENGAVGNDLMLTIKKPFLTTERPARLNTVVELLTKTGLKFKK